MTNDEFKAWFDGFCENLEGTPNEKQWQKIIEKVEDLDGDRITYPIFVDRYWPKRYPLYEATYYSSNNKQEGMVSNFNSTKAMYQLGREDGLDDDFQAIMNAEIPEEHDPEKRGERK